MAQACEVIVWVVVLLTLGLDGRYKSWFEHCAPLGFASLRDIAAYCGTHDYKVSMGIPCLGGNAPDAVVGGKFNG
jgi:hypothetical protein